MKKLKKVIALLICILLAAGCGNKNSAGGKGVSSTSSVDEVINNQISEKKDNKTETMENGESLVKDEFNDDTGDNINSTEDAQKTDGTVDYDLTQMSSDMVYATVFQMMVAPEEYEGKTFRIDGNFYATYYEATQKYYFYCIIQDATACCAQGLEFVWGDGSHLYPDEYPDDNAEILVEGTFETYREEGDDNLYCRLSDATLQCQ